MSVTDKMDSFDTIVITHGGCQDGTASAWVVREYLRTHAPIASIKYVFASKRNLELDIAPLTLEDLRGKDLFITDYSYAASVLAKIPYSSLTWIDHHEHSDEEI
jgi:oligoribonuclease NrnB/cAMP/cGMP phosphodiesterase (DHH superfamily)